MKLIINADDLGANDQINSATFDLMAAGCLTSATIMANGAAFREACRHLGQFPKCSFGVHLNFTADEMLTRSEALRPLRAYGDHPLAKLQSVRFTRHLKEAVYAEWCAQIGRLLECGIVPSHIDSHHHVHTLPALFGVLKAVQRQFRIRRVRLTRNLFLQPKPLALRLKKFIWNQALRHFYATTTTRRFCDLSTLAALDPRARRRHPSVEAMVHPGSPDYDAETRILRDPSVLGLRQVGVELISYRELGENP